MKISSERVGPAKFAPFTLTLQFDSENEALALFMALNYTPTVEYLEGLGFEASEVRESLEEHGVKYTEKAWAEFLDAIKR